MELEYISPDIQCQHTQTSPQKLKSSTVLINQHFSSQSIQQSQLGLDTLNIRISDHLVTLNSPIAPWLHIHTELFNILGLSLDDLHARPQLLKLVLCRYTLILQDVHIIKFSEAARQGLPHLLAQFPPLEEIVDHAAFSLGLQIHLLILRLYLASQV